MLPLAEAELTYIKAEVPICDLSCEILVSTEKIFDVNYETNMEAARLEALVEMRDILIDKIDESPYYDYQAKKDKYGYL